MADADLLALGVVALGVALAALLAAIFCGLWALSDHLRQRADAREAEVEFAEVQTEALAIDELRTDILLLEMEYQFEEERRANYRHNVHCPACGRFSRRVFGHDDIVECSKHEIQVVWKEVPVDWAVQPSAFVEGIFITEQHIHAEQEVTLLPLTAPIDIVVPDTLSLEQLQDEGAVL
jgi:hypothetical protein